MAEDVTAISESISMAVRDDAPDTSKTTQPSGDTAAFLQTASRSKHQPTRITEILTTPQAEDGPPQAHHKLTLPQMRSKTHPRNFQHIVKKINDMTTSSATCKKTRRKSSASGSSRRLATCNTMIIHTTYAHDHTKL